MLFVNQIFSSEKFAYTDKWLKYIVSQNETTSQCTFFHDTFVNMSVGEYLY